MKIKNPVYGIPLVFLSVLAVCVTRSYYANGWNALTVVLFGVLMVLIYLLTPSDPKGPKNG